MKINLIHFLIVFGMFAMTCGNKTDMAKTSETLLTADDISAYSDGNSKFTEVTITSRASFGGVRSNLAATRNYTVKFDMELKDEIRFTRLMVDSIALLFTKYEFDGITSDKLVLDKTVQSASLLTYRNVYSKDILAPKVFEVIEYKKSGLQLGNKAVAEYFIGDKPYYLELGEIEFLPNIHMP